MSPNYFQYTQFLSELAFFHFDNFQLLLYRYVVIRQWLNLIQHLNTRLLAVSKQDHTTFKQNPNALWSVISVAIQSSIPSKQNILPPILSVTDHTV